MRRLARIWRRFRQSWAGVSRRARYAWRAFVKGPPERYDDKDGALRNVLTGQRRAPGFPCPRCTHRVHIDLASLLTQSDASCSACGLVLKMHWEPDDRARAALGSLIGASKRVEEAKRFRR